MRKYRLSDIGKVPKTVRAADASAVDVRELYRQAGVELPERGGVSRLRRRWRDHAAGAFVIFSSEFMFVFDR